MAEKRRDSRGRVLRSGEAQRADGKYMFRYMDGKGERQTVYSWRLVETDKTPGGKRDCKPLRTIEKQVLQDVDDGIDGREAGNITVNMMFDKFLTLRTELRRTTRGNYICLYDKHVRYSLGRKIIKNVKYSDVYKFYSELSEDSELSVSSIQKINSIVWQLFEIAVKDNILRKNPADEAMKNLAKRLDEEPKAVNALTIEQQSLLLKYVYHEPRYKKYSPLFTTLLGTGMRIGEALGLTWDDIDFKNNMIHVSHSLSYKSADDSGYVYHITAPKTRAGIRTIPMFNDVRSVMQKAKRERKYRDKVNFTVDGYTGFVFLNSAGKVYTPTFFFGVIQNMVEDYNREEMELSRQESREPKYLPRISAHTFRHTFCTRLCENESNLKVIQDIMGHKTIRTTIEVYSDATDLTKQASFKELEGKIQLR